jgi:hypothetical protein
VDDCFDIITEDESFPPAILAGGGWASRTSRLVLAFLAPAKVNNP